MFTGRAAPAAPADCR